MIPDKNLFIVSSAIKPIIGVIPHKDRYEQTIESLKSLKEKTENSIILVSDVSLTPLTDQEKSNLVQYCDVLFDASDIPLVRELSFRGLKSHAENALMFNTLMNLKMDSRLQKVLYQVKRIFKFSARSVLTEDFDITKYDNLFGKYVFKTRIPTWMPKQVHGASHLFITRMFSFCPSLIDSYLEVVQKNFQYLNDIDTEHAHFVNIPQKYLVEFDTIGCEGILAGNGSIERY